MSNFPSAKGTLVEAYFVQVAEAMQREFNISEQEAIDRINKLYEGKIVTAKDDWVFYESPEDEAKFYYYDSGVLWWVEGETLVVRPYP